MTDGLRKGLASYGDAGFSLFLRKAFIKAMGYSDDALDRPIVGITNTHSDYNPCHGNSPQIIEAVKRGVMLAGALPMRAKNLADREGLALSRRQHEIMIELLRGRDNWALAQLCVDHMQYSKSDYLGRIAGDAAEN